MRKTERGGFLSWPCVSHAVLFVLVAGLGTRVLAQDISGLEQGLKPYGSYHGGDIDSISMVNGSLSVHIPLVSYPQRGGKLHVDYSIIYNTPSISAKYSTRCSNGGLSMCMPSQVYYQPSASSGFGIYSDIQPTVIAKTLSA